MRKLRYKELKEIISNISPLVSEPLWEMNELLGYPEDQVENAEQLILNELESTPIFPSDFSEKYGFEYKLVYLCFKDLSSKGLVE